jgi:hypothetical protein
MKRMGCREGVTEHRTESADPVLKITPAGEHKNSDVLQPLLQRLLLPLIAFE